MNEVRGHRGDYVLGLVVFILVAFGLVMMYNINPALSQRAGGHGVNFFNRQLIFVGIGVVVWAVVSHIYYQNWRRYAPWLLVIAVISILALMLPGLSYRANGATRWLRLGPLSFQPAELLKIAMVVYLAAWFETHRKDIRSGWDVVMPFTIMVGLAAIAVVFFQRDMGTMLVLASAAVGMIYMAGIRLKHLVILTAGGLAGGGLLIITAAHRMQRMVAFMNPMADCTGDGYHICQSLIGIGSGGIFGLGLGKSIQINGYLPEAPNDSIFAVIGEEFGLIGSLIVIILFGVLIYRGLEIIRRSPDMFAQLTATGITLVFLFQAFINIGAMLSIVPLTGIPLPFISYGGSSLVIMMMAAGLLFNISRYTIREEAHADSRQWRGDSRPRFAGSSNRRRVSPVR